MLDKVFLMKGLRQKIDLAPFSQKKLITLKPSLQDVRSDVEKIKEELSSFGNVEIPLEIIQRLARFCSFSVEKMTATLGFMNWGWNLIDLKIGEALDNFGLALDIGTTSVVGSLIDLGTGEILETKADYNQQIFYGEDILSRIIFGEKENGLKLLQEAILDTINKIIVDLVDSRKEDEDIEISAVVIGANPTMVQILLGLSPARLCKMPYVATVNRSGCLLAREVGLKGVLPYAPLYCLPAVGSYVGGDVLGGILVSEMQTKEEISLLVDIGTNGEIILGNRDWLIACAGAAGPALEGGVVKSGIRAMPGAIFKVAFDKNHCLSYQTIDNKPALGICGSGLIDFFAGAFLEGLIDRAGKYYKGDNYVLVDKKFNAGGEDIAVSQVDIDNLMRTKGAMNAAVGFLLESVGLEMKDIKKFYSAGAFGQYVDVESAITIGLYPDLDRDKMKSLGNSSLEGARQVLLSLAKKKEIEKIADNITYFELNINQDFMNKFVGSKFIPHTNLDYYPSVKAKLAALKKRKLED